MLQVLDGAINLGDERDARLTLAQRLRCKRKGGSSLWAEPHGAVRGHHHLQVLVLAAKGGMGRGDLVGPQGLGGHKVP